MLLHMGSGCPVLISIPRDSYATIPGHGYNKINAALACGGANLLIQTVENVTGLKISHYMGIGFGGLVAVVNKIGGVQICLKTAIRDSYSGVNLSAGCHDLTGDRAWPGLVRDRHSFATEDLQRIQDQRAFISALLNKATSPGVYLNPFTALPFGSTAASSMSVDHGTSLLDLVHAASALRDRDGHRADRQQQLLHERRRLGAVEPDPGHQAVPRAEDRLGHPHEGPAGRHHHRLSARRTRPGDTTARLRFGEMRGQR